MSGPQTENASVGGATQPQEVLAELSATEANPADVPPALREEQVQNAVSFLAHPKVRSSSKESKTSFLERKGLTGPEIAEAFKRVPETTTDVPIPTSAVLPVAEQPQVAPRKPFPTGQAVSPVLYAQQQQQQQQQPHRWMQVVIGASVLVAGVYALKQLVGPYATAWYRRFYGIDEPQSSSDATAAADRETAEKLASAISSQTSELRDALEGLKAAVGRLEKGKQPAAAAPDHSLSVADLRSELHAFAATLSSMNGPSESNPDVSEQLKEVKAMLSERLKKDAGPKSPSSAPSGVTGSVPNGVHSIAPPASRFPHTTSPSNPPAANDSLSYQEVMDILEKGGTPPNVRTDIDDKPPNPAATPPKSRLQPPRKPWERSQDPGLGDIAGSSGAGSQTAAPGVTITELDSSPGSSRPSPGAWRPPPVPQASVGRAPPSPADSAGPPQEAGSTSASDAGDAAASGGLNE